MPNYLDSSTSLTLGTAISRLQKIGMIGSWVV